MQAAYQSQISGLPLAQIEKDFLEHSLRKGDKAFSRMFLEKWLKAIGA